LTIKNDEKMAIRTIVLLAKTKKLSLNGTQKTALT